MHEAVETPLKQERMCILCVNPFRVSKTDGRILLEQTLSIDRWECGRVARLTVDGEGRRGRSVRNEPQIDGWAQQSVLVGEESGQSVCIRPKWRNVSLDNGHPAIKLLAGGFKLD